MPHNEKITFAEVQQRINRIRRLWDRAWDRQDYALAFRCKDLYLSLLARSTMPDEAEARAVWVAERKALVEMN